MQSTVRNLFAFSFLLLSFFIGKAQNLVPNGDFEIYDICPNNLSQISSATGWNAARPTPDYLNTCAPYFSHPLNCVAVPLNSFGYRTPASGNGYAGIISKAGSSEDREIIGTQLITPLQVGIKYYVSFKASFIGQMYQPNRCAINKLGVLFSTSPYDTFSLAPICNCAQIYSDSIIIDTLNWTGIQGSFVADSNYSFINIGRFFANSQTSSIQVSGTLGFAYYFIDDVCVSTDSMLCNTSVGIQEPKQNEAVNIYPNPFTNQLSLEVSNAEEVIVHLSDMLGRQVLLATFSSSATISTASLARGVYFYSLENDRGIIKKGKLVKE